MLRFSKENPGCSVYSQQEMACCEVTTILTSQALPTTNSVIKSFLERQEIDGTASEFVALPP
jgi:hypothetical protein